MNFDFTVHPDVYKALLNVDVNSLKKFTSKQIRSILPCLVRMGLITPVDSTGKCLENRREILTILSSIEAVNLIVSLLSVDFHALEVKVKQEQNLRKKLGNSQGDSVLAEPCDNGLALQFERSDSMERLRLVLCELLYIGSQVSEFQKNANEFYIKSSELFDNAVYIPEVCDVINVALAELPALLTIQDIAQTLLHVKHGPDIICWIVANFPDCFYDVCMNLIQNSDKIEDENGGTKIRMETLTALCRMYPEGAYVIRSKCVELCKLPALTITLTLDFPECSKGELGSNYSKTGGDIVPFVSGLLLGNDQSVRNWFSMFTRGRLKNVKESNVALQRLRDELISQLRTLVGQTKDSNKIPYFSVVHGSVLLRLYCALRGIAGIKVQDEEISLLIKLMTICLPPSPEGVRFVSIAVCMLFACPSLISQTEYETKVIHWLKWLSGGDSPFFGKPTDITTSFSEMLLLLAIHVHSGQLTAISDLVCSTLGMRVSIRNTNLSRIKVMFMQEVFTEQVVTSRAISILVTPNLNANIHGFLPIHCIHQLMKSRAFSKHKVNVKGWIYKQICASTVPLHPLLPSLIDVYVNSMLNISNKLPYESVVNERITEEEIMAVFKDSLSHAENHETKTKSFMPQLLLLYYILLYEDVRLSNTQNYANANRVVKSYSAEFLSEFPIKYLLQQAQKDQQCYSGLFSSLLRLLATHFPHLSLVEDWLEDEDSSLTFVSTRVISEESLAEALQNMSTCPSRASGLLTTLLTIPLKEMWPYVNIFMKYLRSTLDKNVPLYVQELYKKVWLRFNSVLPRSLWVMTIKALLHEEATLPSVPPKQEKIIIDPLQILRCDDRVFRCPAVLSIVIRVLQSSLAASRSQLSRHLMDGPLSAIQSNQVITIGGLTTDVEREELKNALIAAQESAALQILLESCLETDDDIESKAQRWSLREVQSIICSFLHQTFIADPSLCKLVHFQGYPRELLPVTVTGIPSMHICVDFIAELISQPSLEKQEFAVDLISQLALQYALPHSMMVSRLALNTLTALLTALPAFCRTELFVNTLPAFARICEAFPPLIEDTIILLIQLGKISISETALKGGSVSLSMTASLDDGYLSDGSNSSCVLKSNDCLYKGVEEVFALIISKAVLKHKIY
ncbi:integrator complex subunit 2 [Planococcus citri]|uniref:integrator complex subunit 2 n=1 Tax=Planococcus citri TaxID=170843 RepID=UPI0031F9F586